jgi:predicted glycosyltransferase
MKRRPRALFYSQHLVGVGHYYRVRELARALSADFEVHVINGGRRIPGAPLPAGVALAMLPPLFRQPETGELAALDEEPLADVLERRLARVVETVRGLAPDLFVVEYFPFQRWELATEILAAIDCARASNPRLVVCCGVRDVPRAPEETLADSVIATLNARFDYVLVHGDERVTRLQDHFPRLSEVRIPVLYTGYVSQGSPVAAAPGRHVVASAGGGVDGFELLAAAARTWRELVDRGMVEERQLIMFAGPFMPQRDRAALEPLCAKARVMLRSFSDDFLACLAAAEMSISRAGYNTCANLLESRVPAVLVPSGLVSDQAFRARRLADMRLAEVVDPSDLERALPEAMVRCLQRGRVRHAIALDGAEFMRSFAARVCGLARA